MARVDDLARRIKPLFEENFSRFGELGAAVSIWRDGRSVLDLHGGFCDARREKPWTNETLVLFWSATKGLGSACLLHLLQEHAIRLERKVAEFWPEFVRSLVPPGVSQLFFFDGEKIKRLAEEETEAATLAQSVKGLLGLDVVEQLRADLDLYASRQMKKTASGALATRLAEVEASER